MPIKKICSWRGCSKVLDEGVLYCDYHQKKWDKANKARNKEYDLRRYADKETKKRKGFYNSDDWIRISNLAISSCYGIDILEYYRTGIITQGRAVHHIIELTENWDCRLDVLNLIYLTEKNHRRVHAEYDKSIKGKKAMQNILFRLIDKFDEEFG